MSQYNPNGAYDCLNTIILLGTIVNHHNIEKCQIITELPLNDNID